MIRKILILIGWALVFVMLYNFYGMVRVAVEKPRISEVEPTVVVSTAEPTQTNIAAPSLVPETATITPIPPTPVPSPIQGFLLDGKIDVASHRATALSIRLREGGELASTWADAYAYADGETDVFDPHKGTIYTIMGDTLVLYAHSGRIYYKPILFASNLDLFLRKDENGNFSLAEGQAKLDSIVGASAYLCQAEGIKPFTVYDPKFGCPGTKLELRISAGALITQDKVAGFTADPLKAQVWLSQNYPGRGFEFLSSGNSFLFVTCVEQYPDQSSVPGVEPFEFNRAVFAFTLIRE